MLAVIISSTEKCVGFLLGIWLGIFADDDAFLGHPISRHGAGIVFFSLLPQRMGKRLRGSSRNNGEALWLLATIEQDIGRALNAGNKDLTLISSIIVMGKPLP